MLIYDNNQLIQVSYPDETSVSYTYDAASNRTAMTDSTGTTTYTYDISGRLLSTTTRGNTVEYQYDLNGNITEITYPDGTKVNYTYNELNQQVEVIEGEIVTSISYDSRGNRIQEELPNGTIVIYTYDLNNRLTEVRHELDEVVIAKSAYTLDNIGNRLTMTDEQGRTTYYSYDNLSQLIEVYYPGGRITTYTYDPVGNRLTENGVIYSYDAANRLIQVNDTIYTYDANGNLLSSGEVTYEYVYENRLITYTDDETITTYTYDGDGNRISQAVTTIATDEVQTFQYIYDINKGLPLLLVEIVGENEYLYVYAGRVISQINPDGQAYYHQDGLGSILIITDEDGDELNRYEYDAFGTPDKLLESIYNPFLFTGEPYDHNGLIFLRARYYDPKTGRFLTKDTYLGTLHDPLSQHLYVYVGNNPVLYVDPSGHLKICQGGNIFKDVIKWQANIQYQLLLMGEDYLGRIDMTNSTGIVVSGSFGPYIVSGQGGLSTDTKGNYGIQWAPVAGFTGGSPFGGSVSLYSMQTNAPSIFKLEGEGYQAGGSLNLALLTGLEANLIPDREENTAYVGLTRLVGIGSPGGEVHVEGGNTRTEMHINIFRIYEKLYRRIMEW